MKLLRNSQILLVIVLTLYSCTTRQRGTTKSNIVFRSEALVITQISSSAYVHTSFKSTQDFGYVPCNGLVVTNGGEAIVFDTPTNDSSAAVLIDWISTTLDCKINAVIPTHFHDDCLGGLNAFEAQDIPSYAHTRTIALAKANQTAVPRHGFTDSLILKVGSTQIYARFFGEGHTQDNIVGYFPAEDILFGGCLIKAKGASKGYLGDANVTNWSATVEKVKQAYPKANIVVPGHGDSGNKKLLDYTIELFKAQ